MRVTRGLNTAQRVVIVVALGVAFVVIGLYVSDLRHPASGDYASPVNAKMLPPSVGLPAWLRFIIWLALTGIWAASSIVALRRRQDSGGQH